MRKDHKDLKEAGEKLGTLVFATLKDDGTVSRETANRELAEVTDDPQKHWSTVYSVAGHFLSELNNASSNGVFKLSVLTVMVEEMKRRASDKSHKAHEHALIERDKLKESGWNFGFD